MNTYLVMLTTGSSQEVDADSYERDGSDWSFSADGVEVLRFPADGVPSITKA